MSAKLHEKRAQWRKGMVGFLLLSMSISVVHADVELSNEQIARTLTLQGVAFLNDNQIARLSNSTTSSVYAASDIHNYFAYEDTFKGQARYNESKAGGQDPSKYLTWISGDDKKREKLVADKKLILLPYNTRVRVIKYQKDKLEDWYLQQTGTAKRLGRYQVQVMVGPNKDVKVWTQDVVDLFPHTGDTAYIGIQPDTKTPSGTVLNATAMVSFDEYALFNYWDATMKGDDKTRDMYLNVNSVFSVGVNTKCKIIKEEKLPPSYATYYHVQINDGANAGKSVWTLNVSIDPFPT